MLVVVGGHSRKIGKTSVIEALIRAMPEAHWTAIKISPHSHKPGGGAANPGCPAWQPGLAAPRPDKERFSAAGAVRSYLLPLAPIDDFHRILHSSENVIAESNSILEFISPDLYLVVLDFSVLDFKESSRKYLDRANALVIVERGIAEPPWEGVPVEGKKKFFVAPPSYLTPELAEFVRRRMGRAQPTNGRPQPPTEGKRLR